MALPTSRNTTYASGVPVKSADLNDIQDRIVQLNAQQVADTEVWLPASVGRWFQQLGEGGVQEFQVAELVQAGGANTVIKAVNAYAAGVEFALAVPVGWRLVDARAIVLGSAASPMFGRLYVLNASANTKVAIGTTKAATQNATVQTLGFTASNEPAALPYIVGAGESLVYEVQFGPSPAGQEIRGVAFRYRRPV